MEKVDKGVIVLKKRFLRNTLQPEEVKLLQKMRTYKEMYGASAKINVVILEFLHTAKDFYPEINRQLIRAWIEQVFFFSDKQITNAFHRFVAKYPECVVKSPTKHNINNEVFVFPRHERFFKPKQKPSIVGISRLGHPQDILRKWTKEQYLELFYKHRIWYVLNIVKSDVHDKLSLEQMQDLFLKWYEEVTV